MNKNNKEKKWLKPPLKPPKKSKLKNKYMLAASILSPFHSRATTPKSTMKKSAMVSLSHAGAVIMAKKNFETNLQKC